MSGSTTVESTGLDLARVAMRSLEFDEIELRVVNLDAQPAAITQGCRELLSNDEDARTRAFHFERDGRRFAVGRGILRMLLARELGRRPEQLVFSYGAHGKPALASGPAATDARDAIYFNVSHADGLAVYALSHVAEVGVDVEFIREIPEWEAIAAAHFTGEEQAQLRTRSGAARRADFFQAWTKHEAALKARGSGLGAGRDDGSAPLRMHTFEPAPGFVGAVATISFRVETFARSDSP